MSTEHGNTQKRPGLIERKSSAMADVATAITPKELLEVWQQQSCLRYSRRIPRRCPARLA
jgi:hypothetical protein